MAGHRNLTAGTIGSIPTAASTNRFEAMLHQDTGAAFLAMRGFAVLADEPGLGKSFTAIRAADMAKARKILVVCPAVVRVHWENEFLEQQRIDRPVRVAGGFLDFVPGDGVTIVSHATLADVPFPGQKRAVGKSWPNLMNGAPYDLIVLDEAHLMRDFNAVRTRNMWSPDGGMWSWARRVWCLTGTPMVNSAADFWPLFYGPLRQPIAWYDWGIRYAEPKTDDYGAIRFIGLKNASDLADQLRPHLLRRTLASVGIRLPPLTVAHERTAIPPEALNQAMAGLEGWSPARLSQALEENDELHDSALARVRKALGLAKMPGIAERIESIVASGNGPVVVFFQHTAVREGLFDALHRGCGHVVSWIDGKITRPQLRAAVEWFQAGRIDVLLVQTDAGGVGITLTRGNRAVVAELPWTAVGLYQAIARIHRIGQKRACLAEVMRANGCWLEDSLAGTVARKHRAATELMSLLETNT